MFARLTACGRRFASILGPMKRIARPLLVATVLSVVLAGAALGAARLPSLLTGWNGRYTVRPTSIYYTGDGSGVVGVLRRRGGLGGPGRGYLHWKAWNGRGAYAVGSLWLKLATPTATSPFTRFAVSVVLGRPRFGHFTQMTLHYRLSGRRVADTRCVPDRQKVAEWRLLLHGRCA